MIYNIGAGDGLRGGSHAEQCQAVSHGTGLRVRHDGAVLAAAVPGEPASPRGVLPQVCIVLYR